MGKWIRSWLIIELFYPSCDFVGCWQVLSVKFQLWGFKLFINQLIYSVFRYHWPHGDSNSIVERIILDLGIRGVCSNQSSYQCQTAPQIKHGTLDRYKVLAVSKDNLLYSKVFIVLLFKSTLIILFGCNLKNQWG